jgi:hypothetical protein
MAILLFLSIKKLVPAPYAIIGLVPLTIGWIVQLILWVRYDKNIPGGLNKVYWGIGVVVVLFVNLVLYGVEGRQIRRQQEALSSQGVSGDENGLELIKDEENKFGNRVRS